MANIDFWTALQGYSDEALRRMGYSSEEIVDMRYAVRRDRKERAKGRGRRR